VPSSQAKARQETDHSNQISLDVKKHNVVMTDLTDLPAIDESTDQPLPFPSNNKSGNKSNKSNKKMKKSNGLSLENQQNQNSDTVHSRTMSIFLMGKNVLMKPSQKAMSDHFLNEKYGREDLPSALVSSIVDVLEQSLVDVYENLAGSFSRFQRTKTFIKWADVSQV